MKTVFDLGTTEQPSCRLLVWKWFSSLERV